MESDQVLRCKLLRFAIKEKNVAAIKFLVNRVKYGIAFEDNEKHVILSEDEKDLPIQLLYISNWNRKLIKTFHVGFEFKERSESNWVVADLPNLNNVRITKSVSKMEPRFIQEMLPLLVRCRSPRPLFAAFRGLIEPDAQLKDKSFLRDYICKNGSEQVVVEYITEYGKVIFKGIEKLLHMIESAINNHKVLGYLLTALSKMQTSDNPVHKQLISDCLYNCLQLSIECKGVAALQILLKDHGCVTCVINSVYGEKRDTLLQLALRKKGKIEFIKSILKALSDKTENNLTHIKDGNSKMIPLIDWKNTDNHTALHICVQNECKEVIDVNTAILEELLSYNARINYTDEGADTIVHFIVKKRKAPILAFKILMKIHHISDHALTHFGNLPFLDAKDKDGKTAIHVCIENRNKDLLKILLTFAHDPLSQDPNGDTALHLAVYTQDLEFVELVNFYIQHTIIEARNNKGYTALHCAIDHAKNTIADHLLKCGADFFTTDDNKQNILHHAIQLPDPNCRQMIDYIITYNNEPIITKMLDGNNRCPLHLAVILKNIPAVKTLLDWDSSILCYKKKDDKSVLHLVFVTEPRKPVCEEILDYILEKIKFLEEKAQQWLCNRVIDYQDNLEKSVLHYCILHNNGSALKKLLALSPDLGLEDNLGNTPLHQAVLDNEHVSLLQPLLDSIKDENGLKYSSNLLGFRPLQLAISQNNLPAIETLINDRNKFQLAYPPDSEAQTLCNGIGRFLLRFLSPKLDSTSIYTGYLVKYGDKEYWVMAKLPELKVTEYIISVDCIQYSEISIEVLLSVLQCRSQDPLKAVFENKMCQVNAELSNELFLSQLVSQHSTQSVMEYYLTKHCTTLYTFPPDRKSMIESAICNTKNIDTIRLLLSKVNTDNPDVKKCLHNSLEISLANEGEEALSLLLEYTSVLNDLYGPENDTLLHLIAENNKASTFISCLLDKVKDLESKTPQSTFINNSPFIDVRNSDSKTALHIIIENEDMENLRKLLEYGPSLKIPDDRGDTPLHYAVSTKNIDIVGVILDQINRDNPEIKELKNIKGCTPLHCAVFIDNLEITKLLIEQGCSFISTDCVGRTILHYAVIIPQPVQKISKMVNYILKHDELHHNHGHKIVDLIVEEIIKHGDENVIDLRDKDMKTALHLSIDNKNHYALERLLTAGPNLELIDASENTYLHKAVEIVDDSFFLRTILTNLSENTIQTLLTRLNNIELPPLQYAILNKNYSAADILVGKGAKLDFQKEGRRRLCNDTDKLKLKVVEYKSQCWVGFEIQTAAKSYFVITQLPSLEGDTYVSAVESHNIKSYNKEKIKSVMRHICECESSDPFNNLLQNDQMSLEDNFQQIGKFATEEVIQTFFDNNKNALYHQASGESMIESAVSNPNLKAFEFLLSKLPEFQQKDISSANPTDSKDAQISLCVKNSLRKSLSNTNTGALKCLLKGFTKINYLYPNEETLIHLAISRGNSLDFLEAIVQKVGRDGTYIGGISFVDKQSKEKKQTALHICIAKKQKENLEVLLRNSADPFLCDSEANTALHYSVLTNNLHFVETIFNTTLEKAKLLQQTNADNHSALHLAVKGENPKIVEFLVKSLSPFYPVMDKEPTLLHLAIRIRNESAQTEIMNQLFKHENVGHVKFPMTRLKDDRGYPPLHLATDLRNNDAVTLLLKVDPSVLYIQDPSGKTPLHISLIQSTSGIKDETRDFSIFKTIFDNIPAPCGKNLDLPAQDKDTIIPPLYAKTPCCPSCHVNNVICTQDDRKRTAMHYAIQYGRLKAFKQLLTTHSCLSIPDKDGYPLHYEAVKNGTTDIQFLELLEEELTRRTGGHHLDCFKFETDYS